MPNILLCGAEGEQFLFENTLVSTGADDKRRGSVLLGAGDQMYRKFDQGYADFWVHVRMAMPADFTSNYNSDPLPIVNITSDGTSLAQLMNANQSNKSVGAIRFDAQDTGPTFPVASMEWITYDIHVTVVDNVTKVDFYRNQVLRRSASYAGSLLPNEIMIQCKAADPDFAAVYVQDVVITDGLPTVGVELATLVPSALGSYDDFANDYSAIDDTGYNQSSTISSTAVGDKESWFFSDPDFNLGDKVIYGVAMTMVAQTDLSGVIADFQPFLRVGAVDYNGASIGANNVSPNAYTTVWTVNPATAAPWDVADLKGLEAGVETV